MSDYAYENMRRVVYGDYESGRAHYVPVCPTCGRFVKADAMINFTAEGIAGGANATCKRDGRVEMPFEGFI